MITIRIEEDENLVTILNEETAIDCNDCVDINKDFDSLTIQECLDIYHQKMAENYVKRALKIAGALKH